VKQLEFESLAEEMEPLEANESAKNRSLRLQDGTSDMRTGQRAGYAFAGHPGPLASRSSGSLSPESARLSNSAASRALAQ
jgi:hypothetical protein